MSKDLKAIAYHEAGHGVADVRFKFACPTLTITPGRDSLGHTQSLDEEDYIRPDGSVDEKRAGETIITLLAGYAAEVKYDSTHKTGAALGAKDDFQKAAIILGRLAAAQVFKHWQQKARDFVKQPQNWKAIEMIARELLDVHTLDGQSVEHIVEIADGKKTATYDLTRWRQLSGLPPTRQFPFKGRRGGS